MKKVLHALQKVSSDTNSLPLVCMYAFGFVFRMQVYTCKHDVGVFIA